MAGQGCPFIFQLKTCIWSLCLSVPGRGGSGAAVCRRGSQGHLRQPPTPTAPRAQCWGHKSFIRSSHKSRATARTPLPPPSPHCCVILAASALMSAIRSWLMRKTKRRLAIWRKGAHVKGEVRSCPGPGPPLDPAPQLHSPPPPSCCSASTCCHPAQGARRCRWGAGPRWR